ncbi:alpha/beta hydrolase [Amycolatopsis pigmentata]|uniref:Alpha/beta hydrolase n=1 Tax=Amycolatopsis pigmentata TaxID=450801 RepID=A0ABW5G6K2_9PSEU
MRVQKTARADISFRSNGVESAAWHYRATSKTLATEKGRPCVVLAHGFGGTRDSGLEGFAEAFAAAGVDSLVFDYRTFGASAGEPRQLVDIDAQLEDYTAAVTCARTLDDVDADRVVVWGVSLSGGHVFRIAAGDQRLAGAISLTPATDGAATARLSVKHNGVGRALTTSAAGLVGAVAAARNKHPFYQPLTGHPGDPGAVNAPGAFEGYTAIAGPTWENRYTMRNALSFARYHPGREAPKISCPVLVQIADLDQSAPPLVAAETAKKLRSAEVRHYPCDHFDVYPGREWHEQVVRHQVDFLSRRLASPPPGS